MLNPRKIKKYNTSRNEMCFSLKTSLNKFFWIWNLVTFFAFLGKNFSKRIWYFSFHAVRDLPEKLIEGKEDTYINWFYDYWSYTQSAITSEAREEYIKQYSKPGSVKLTIDL